MIYLFYIRIVKQNKILRKIVKYLHKNFDEKFCYFFSNSRPLCNDEV